MPNAVDWQVRSGRTQSLPKIPWLGSSYWWMPSFRDYCWWSNPGCGVDEFCDGCTSATINRCKFALDKLRKLLPILISRNLPFLVCARVYNSCVRLTILYGFKTRAKITQIFSACNVMKIFSPNCILLIPQLSCTHPSQMVWARQALKWTVLCHGHDGLTWKEGPGKAA